MKKLNLFQKHFVYTLSLMLVIVFLIHSLIYTLIPMVYLNQKREDLESLTTELVDHLEDSPIESVFDFTEKFALMTNTNINLSTEGYGKTFLGLMQFDIQIRDDLSLSELQKLQENLFVSTPGTIDQAGLILNKKIFRLNDNTKATIQVMMSVQPVYEIKEATLRLVPYSFILSVLISFAAAYYYSRKMTQPILDLLEITDKMAAFEKDIHFESDMKDELSALGYNINNMYDKLKTAIYELEDNIEEMQKIEKEREHFFKSASHELKTPLSSLSILLENMQLNIGIYQDRDLYLKEALQLVNNANEKISQILSASEFHLIDIQQNEIDIKTILEQSISRFKYIISKKELRIILDLEPVIILTDEMYFKTVIDNILSNAFYYAKEKGTVSLSLSNDIIIIKNDINVTKKLDTKLMFEPFYRQDTSNTSISKGTGLGLYLVAKNLEILNLDYFVEIVDESFIFNIYI